MAACRIRRSREYAARPDGVDRIPSCAASPGRAGSRRAGPRVGNPAGRRWGCPRPAVCPGRQWPGPARRTARTLRQAPTRPPGRPGLRPRLRLRWPRRARPAPVAVVGSPGCFPRRAAGREPRTHRPRGRRLRPAPSGASKGRRCRRLERGRRGRCGGRRGGGGSQRTGSQRSARTTRRQRRDRFIARHDGNPGGALRGRSFQADRRRPGRDRPARCPARLRGAAAPPTGTARGAGTRRGRPHGDAPSRAPGRPCAGGNAELGQGRLGGRRLGDEAAPADDELGGDDDLGDGAGCAGPLGQLNAEPAALRQARRRRTDPSGTGPACRRSGCGEPRVELGELAAGDTHTGVRDLEPERRRPG